MIWVVSASGLPAHAPLAVHARCRRRNTRYLCRRRAAPRSVRRESLQSTPRAVEDFNACVEVLLGVGQSLAGGAELRREDALRSLAGATRGYFGALVVAFIAALSRAAWASASASGGTFQASRCASVVAGSTGHRIHLPSTFLYCVPHFCGLCAYIMRSSDAAASHRAASCAGSRSTALTARSCARWISSGE